MAIDPLNEQLILPDRVPEILPPGPSGKRIHTSAIYRYMSSGVRGVVLESLNAPRKCTSKEAVARFLARLSSQDQMLVAQKGVAATYRGKEATESELDRIGF